MTPIQIIITIIVMVLAIFLVIIAGYSVYFAFIKKKDERSKMIVLKSMSQSFIIILIFQTIQCVLKLIISYDVYEKWQANFKAGIYLEPVMLSLIIYGITFLINKKHMDK